jgi:hypothetical protein
MEGEDDYERRLGNNLDTNARNVFNESHLLHSRLGILKKTTTNFASGCQNIEDRNKNPVRNFLKSVKSEDRDRPGVIILKLT